jgi:hypothetical protein
MRSIKSGTLTILGTRWKYAMLSQDAFARAHGVDTRGICLSQPRQMLFPEGGVTLGNVRHELLHAYLFSLPTASADLSLDQFEEVVADLLGDHWETMDRQARQIHSKLIVLK